VSAGASAKAEARFAREGGSRTVIRGVFGRSSIGSGPPVDFCSRPIREWLAAVEE
jgi:hypothetical protein